MFVKPEKKSASGKGGRFKENTIEEQLKANETTNIKDFLFNPNAPKIPEHVIVSIQGKKVATVGNVFVITGKPKSRKSVVAHSIISASINKTSVLGIECNLPGENDEVVLIDTEQATADLQTSIERIKQTTPGGKIPKNIKIYTVRMLTPDRILNVITEVCKNTNTRLILIDGGLDLIMNMNDVIEAKELIQFFKNTLSEFNVCIGMIIHQSKSTNFTIGHFGSFMDRFAQSNIEVTKLENGNSEIRSQLMRSDADFKKYEFYWNYNENNYSVNWIEQLEVTAKYPGDFSHEQHKNILKRVYSNAVELTHKSIVEQMITHYQKSEKWCKDCVKYLFEAEILSKGKTGILFNELPF
jgi:hypothetical protein